MGIGHWITVMHLEEIMAIVIVIWDSMSMKENVLKLLETFSTIKNYYRRNQMSKSALVMNTQENCYDCPFGTAYCGELEYEGLCELAYCLDCDEILITERTL